MDLVILAAGSGTRFKSEIRKELATIHGKSNLANTIDKLEHLFDKITIVINKVALPIFVEALKTIPSNKKYLVAIDSGFGPGHALLHFIKENNVANEFILLYGDAYIKNSRMVEELIHYQSVSDLIIPVDMVTQPYIRFALSDSGNGLYVDFSRSGEKHEKGLKDRGLFKIKKSLLFYLEYFHNACWKKYRYVTETGQFEFLYLIHLMSNLNSPAHCYVTQNTTSVYTYNTVEQLAQIEKLVNDQTDASILPIE